VVSCTDSLARKSSCIYRYFAGAEVGERVGEGGNAGGARAGSFLKESSCVRGSSACAGNGVGGGACADFSARRSSFVQERPETWAAPQATGELSVPVLLVTFANYLWVQKARCRLLGRIWVSARGCPVRASHGSKFGSLLTLTKALKFGI
jgi:hypothetical protein